MTASRQHAEKHAVQGWQCLEAGCLGRPHGAGAPRRLWCVLQRCPSACWAPLASLGQHT